MKHNFGIILFAIILLFSLNVQAKKTKNSLIGIGTYVLSVTNNQADRTDGLTGYGFSSTYAFIDNFSVRGQYYLLEHNNINDIKAMGFDLVAYVGVGLATEGFKVFLGGGMFNETWKSPGFKEGFNGWQISGGFGYNMNFLSLEFILNKRQTNDYENFIENEISGATITEAASGSLLLSARF